MIFQWHVGVSKNFTGARLQSRRQNHLDETGPPNWGRNFLDKKNPMFPWGFSNRAEGIPSGAE
jgi:hypothetical protein